MLIRPGQTDSQVDASQRKFSTCGDLRQWTSDNLRWFWSSSNSYASRRTFFTVLPPNASRHTLIASHLYMSEICDLLELANRLAIPFGHPSQLRTQVLVLQTCVDSLCRHATPVSQDFTPYYLTFKTSTSDGNKMESRQNNQYKPGINQYEPPVLYSTTNPRNKGLIRKDFEICEIVFNRRLGALSVSCYALKWRDAMTISNGTFHECNYHWAERKFPSVYRFTIEYDCQQVKRKIDLWFFREMFEDI